MHPCNPAHRWRKWFSACAFCAQCTTRQTGEYRYNYGLILEIAGGVTFAVAMACFFLLEWRTRRQMRLLARPVAAPLADTQH